MIPASDRDWLTLQQCAKDIGVKAETLRQLCVRWRAGKPHGLPYAHFGSMPESETQVVLYRIHREKWEEFKRERARGGNQEDRRAPRPYRRLVVVPIEYAGSRQPGRRAKRAAAERPSNDPLSPETRGRVADGGAR